MSNNNIVLIHLADDPNLTAASNTALDAFKFLERAVGKIDNNTMLKVIYSEEKYTLIKAGDLRLAS